MTSIAVNRAQWHLICVTVVTADRKWLDRDLKPTSIKGGKFMQTASAQHEKFPIASSREATKPAVLQKLLVAYDFSGASEIALRYATEIARRFHSDIVLAHIETPETLGERMDDGIAKAKLEQLAERHDLNLVANRLRSEGIESVSRTKRIGYRPSGSIGC